MLQVVLVDGALIGLQVVGHDVDDDWLHCEAVVKEMVMIGTVIWIVRLQVVCWLS